MKFIPSLEMKTVFYFVFIIIIIIFKAWKVGKLTQGACLVRVFVFCFGFVTFYFIEVGT